MMKRNLLLLISCFLLFQCSNGKHKKYEETLTDTVTNVSLQDSNSVNTDNNKPDSTILKTANKGTNQIEQQKLITYFNTGLEKFNQEKYKEAIEQFSKVIEADPANFHSYFNRGLSKYRLKEYNGAIKDFNKAIKINPKSFEAYKNRADAKTYIQDLTGSINDYNKSIELNPKYRDAYKNRGLVNLMLKQNDAGCKDLNKAAEMGDNDVYQIIQQNCK